MTFGFLLWVIPDRLEPRRTEQPRAGFFCSARSLRSSVNRIISGPTVGANRANNSVTCHTSTTAGYNEVREYGDDDDAGTVSDQAGGRHADSGGLVRNYSVLPGGGVRDRAGGAGLWAHRRATPGANGPTAGDELPGAARPEDEDELTSMGNGQWLCLGLLAFFFAARRSEHGVLKQPIAHQC